MELRHTAPRKALFALTGALFAAATLLTPETASAASSGLDTLLSALGQEANARTAATAPEVLPPPTRHTKPFRQRVDGNCEVPDAPGVCRFAFAKVGANQLLEISNITCVIAGIDVPGSLFMFATAGKLSGLQLTALLTMVTVESSNPVTLQVGGTFYFAAGERLFVFGPRPADPEAVKFCRIYGLLSRTD